MATDLYQTVTDKIISLMEAGTLPWKKGWSTGGYVPCNATTNRPYSGINVLLYYIAMTSGYEHPKPRFLTFAQAKKSGGTVKKGEHGTPVYFFKPLFKKDPKTGEDVKSGAILRQYHVFNVDQCQGLQDSIVLGPWQEPLNQDQRMELADAFIQSSGAVFGPGRHPAYSTALDKIKMPSWSRFHNNVEFYATAFHELVHWTGHKSRLNRDTGKRFGSESYAAEELIAELGSAFLCAEFGIDNTASSSAYLANWIQILKNDKKAIFTAASAAQKAVDFLRGKALEEEADVEKDIQEAA